MSRVKIVAIFLFLIELAGFILIGKFLYHKETIQLTDKIAKNVTIREKDSTDKTIITFKTGCPLCHEFHVYHKVRLTDNELEEFERNRSIKISWWHLHVKIWIILYYTLVVIGGSLAIFAFRDAMIEECYSEQIYSVCHSCPLYYRCTLYKAIDEIDLEPAKIKWYKFWGYENNS